MAKKAVSASLQKAAKQWIKSASAVKKSKENNAAAKRRQGTSGKQKSTVSVQHKTASNRKQDAEKTNRLKTDPSSVLKQVKRESVAQNKHQSNHTDSLTESKTGNRLTNKQGKEILEVLEADNDRRSRGDRKKVKVYLPVSGYYISSRYGEDRGDHVHSGIDLAVAEGSSVTAVKSGTVIFAGWSSGYGYRIVIDHGDGSETTYSHLSDIGVEKGEAVVCGDQIGLSGNTGHSTGPHLHFEVKVDGEYVNPESYFDFGDGLVASTDQTYVSKISASTKGGNTSSTQYTKIASPALSPVLPSVNETAGDETNQFLQNLLSQAAPSRYFSRREKKETDVDERDMNSLIELIPAYQQSRRQKRTKRTEGTKRKK